MEGSEDGSVFANFVPVETHRRQQGKSSTGIHIDEKCNAYVNLINNARLSIHNQYTYTTKANVIEAGTIAEMGLVVQFWGCNVSRFDPQGKRQRFSFEKFQLEVNGHAEQLNQLKK